MRRQNKVRNIMNMCIFLVRVDIEQKTKWCIEDPIANLENLESLDSSILSSDRSSRSYDWVRARTKKKEDDSYYIANSQTKEVFDKMVNYLILRFIKL